MACWRLYPACVLNYTLNLFSILSLSSLSFSPCWCLVLTSPLLLSSESSVSLHKVSNVLFQRSKIRWQNCRLLSKAGVSCCSEPLFIRCCYRGDVVSPLKPLVIFTKGRILLVCGRFVCHWKQQLWGGNMLTKALPCGDENCERKLIAVKSNLLTSNRMLFKLCAVAYSNL